MNKFDLTAKIENFAPLDTQESWDCSGWIVCTNKPDIKKVMLALTVTDAVYEQAKQNNCDMIISHHPLFFVPIKYCDIDIYCAHTNLDKANGGTTDTLIKKLGFKSPEKYNDFLRIVKLNEPIKINELKERLKKLSPNLRYVNNSKKDSISTISFCAGSGSDFIDSVDTDAYITGDLKFHSALDSKQIVFDIGHFESEIPIIDVLKSILDIDVVIAEESSPFIS